MIVLVVDDSEAMGTMLVEQLRRGGHRALWAGTEAAALAAAAEHKPDVILLDVHLGEHDGMKLARKLRKLPETSGARLIGLSGDPTPPRSKPVLDAFLLKPVRLDELLKTIQN